jgi:FK506-binding nuclear protein
MAAIDPTAKPLEADQPNLATLKIIRRPLDHDDYEDESDEDSEEDEDEAADEEEQEKIQEKSKKLSKKEADKAIKKALKVAEANAMEVDAANKEGSGDDSDDEDEDFGFETEEFVLCTLDPAKVCPGPPLCGCCRC